ncbi:MAG: YceI family protein [Planctomycetota bacterium]|nr:YceI family protein [Planctomycetota bacterium]
MKKLIPLILLSTLLALPIYSSFAQPPSTQSFFSKKDKSEFKIYVWKAGIASGFAHDHIMSVEDFKGQVVYDEKDPSKSNVFIRVEAKSLKVLDPKVKAADKRKIKKSMDSDEVLNVKKYPKITFKSTKVEVKKAAGNVLKVTGKMSLCGQTKTISFPVKIERKGGKLVASGAFKLRQTEFGMKPYSALLGAIKVKDLVDVKFTIVNETQ